MNLGAAAALAGVALCTAPVACGTSHSAPSRPPRGALGPAGTGSFAIVSMGGTEKLYLPEYGTSQGDPSIAVVDMGTAADARGAPASIAEIRLGPGGRSSPGGTDSVDYATTTAGDSSIVVAASTESPVVWFLDPVKDAVVGEIRLDSSYGQSTFDGSGGYVTSVAMDSARRRAILAVWNGFAIVDVDARRIERVVPAPPSENFAYDAVNQRIFAPFYDCPSSLDDRGNTPAACAAPRAPDGSAMTDGLSVIDLEDDTVYTFQSADAADPAAPVGTMPSSAGIDPATGIVIVTSKGHQYQSIIDFSQASFDRRKKSVEAKLTVLRGLGLTDVAIASAEHLAFWEGQDASDVAAASVQSLPSDPDGGSGNDAGHNGPEYVFGRMPALPDGTPWRNVATSHGLSVWPGSPGANAYGVTVSQDYRWVARIDLPTLLSLPAEYHEVSDVSAALTLLDARSPVHRAEAGSSR